MLTALFDDSVWGFDFYELESPKHELSSLITKFGFNHRALM